MKKFVYGFIGIAIIVVAFGATAIMLNGKKDPRRNQSKTASLFVKTTKPITTTVETDALYHGRVNSLANIDVAAEVSGRILAGNIVLKDGATFRKGDVLFRIYSEDVVAQLKASKSSFMQTLAMVLPDISVDFPSEFQKWNTFFSQIDLEKPLPMLPECKSNKERIFMASQNVLTSYYNLKQAEINLEKYTVHALFSGSIVTAAKQVGDMANTGTTVASVIRTDQLEVVVPIQTLDYAWIKVGDQAVLTTASGQNIEAKVTRIGGSVDEDTQSINTYLRPVAGQNIHLLQGEYVDVSFPGKKLTGLLIPREALVGSNQVYQLNNGKLELHDIEVVRQMADTYLIAKMDTLLPVVVESVASIDSTIEYKSRK